MRMPKLSALKVSARMTESGDALSGNCKTAFIVSRLGEKGVFLSVVIMALIAVNASRRTELGPGNKALRIQGRS
jgi:hypothetical protein